MNLNERIRQEIKTRLEKAGATFPDLPDALKPLLEYYEAQSIPALARKLVPELITTFGSWPKDEVMQAAGFEWYYDGRDLPEAMGYAYDAVKTPPKLDDLPVGSDTSRARDDFPEKIKFGSMIFGDSSGFDVAAACFPAYECYDAGIEDEEDEAWDALINLFTLRMFYCLHLALAQATESSEFQALQRVSPFYLFANNHDWSPFLLFVHDGQAVQGDDYEIGEPADTDTSMEVAHLTPWLEGLKQRVLNKKEKEELLRAVSKKSPEELERVLLKLPNLDAGDGYSTVLSRDDLRNFASQTLSQPEYHEKISFDAFARLFELMLAAKKPDLYELHASMIYMFLRDASRAFEFIRDAVSREPGKKEALLDCAKNTIRWAGDDPEHRWPNPNLALSKSPRALKGMERILKL